MGSEMLKLGIGCVGHAGIGIMKTKNDMKTTYRLKSDKMNGHLEVGFQDGLLKEFKIECKDALTPRQYGLFLGTLPHSEERVKDFEGIGLQVVPVAIDKVNDKIALWCRLYERYTGVKYKVSGPDAGKMKSIKVDEGMLRHYFESGNFLFKGKYSIANLVKYYNELQAEIANYGKPSFPNGWDANFAAKLSGSEMSAYYAHLRGLGLKPRRDQAQRIVDWA